MRDSIWTDKSSAGGYYSPSSMFSVCFASGSSTTHIHELLHALGLLHPFDGHTQSAIYTYEDGKADNIMDYGDKCHNLFEWQWYAINTKLNT